MDLRSASPYWLLRHGIINSYPSLNKDIKTEIVIVGAGISGALVADQLCKAGYNVVIVDRRHAGTGSTAASTALLQYEIDKPLHQLIRQVGDKNAIRSYHLCRQAIFDIKKLCEQLKEPGLFNLKPSFQFASVKKAVPELWKEFTLRKKAGFPLQWLEEENIKTKFGFSKHAGLLNKDGAEADAYKITHSLFKKWISRGLQVYDNTEIAGIRHLKQGVELTTADKIKITAKKMIIACGYESQQYIPEKVQQLHATYAIASESYAIKDFWYKNALIWETATPYLYLRTTSDNRILIGGKDVPFTSAIKRDRLLNQKAKSLEKSFNILCPDIPFKTDFKWAGTFASTADGLPYIGAIRQRPHTYFALGYGGNGITFSVIAAKIIRDLISGKKNKDAEIFKFGR
ncbi:MAG: NAD(P)/FAD-dependent oxidoreductase [Chitinophagaceae bacterium]